MDLLVRDACGSQRWIMQADQSVYLHPLRAGLPGPSAMVVGENDFPDVVLEVDYSTDVRRGKLSLYESWGFPEVWVEVPARRAPSRPHETTPPARTYAVIERVGTRLGAREGTGPEDDPLLRSQRRQGRAEGIRQGRADGIRQVLNLERELLRRQAAVRFGADTAERLSGLLDGITDPGRLAEAGE